MRDAHDSVGGLAPARQLHLNQAGRVEADSAFGASGESHLADFGQDNSLVGHHGTGENQKAVTVDLDGSVVDDPGQIFISLLFELQPSGHKVVVGDVKSGDDQAANIDIGPGAEDDSVGIDQKNLTVGSHGTENLRRVLTHHAVQDSRYGVGLNEMDQLTYVDIEAVPVDNGAIARLSDGLSGAVGLNIDGTGLHRRPFRQSDHRGRQGGSQK